MKNKTVWNKPENEFITETIEDGRKCYYGQYTDKAVPFAFRLAEQPAGSRYRCRGTVWAVPPDARGKIYDAKEKRNVITEVGKDVRLIIVTLRHIPVQTPPGGSILFP